LLSAFAGEVAGNPKAARLALVEVSGAARSTARMRHTEGLFEALAIASFGEPSELPPLVAKGIVAGVSHLARRRLLAGQEGTFPADAGPLTEWVLALQDDLFRQVLPGHDGVAAVRGVGRARDGPRSALLGDDRETILSVVARLAGTEGYDALTVPRIRSEAGLSRQRFDRHFESVQDCFLAALELRAGHVFAAARAAHRGAATWPSGVCRAVQAVCGEIAADPVLARLVFFELPAPGREALRWRVRSVAKFAAALQGSAPSELRPSELAAEASVAAAWGVMCDYGTTGRARSLSQLADLLAYFALAPALGAEAAVEAVREEAQSPSRPGKATADRLHR
jgi:AcrR family transcriptional regulator